MKSTYLAAAAVATIAGAAPALATQSFQFEFTCATAGSKCATVSGSFDLDHTGNILAAGDYGTSFSNGKSVGPISNLQAVVSNAKSGNGTFGPKDFSLATFVTTQNLDLTRELVGQGGFGTVTKFGDEDFNIFSASGSSAPSGAGSLENFTGYTNAGSGDKVKLSSLHVATSAVPEPATWMSMILGMGLVGHGLRSRRSRRNDGVIA